MIVTGAAGAAAVADAQHRPTVRRGSSSCASGVWPSKYRPFLLPQAGRRQDGQLATVARTLMTLIVFQHGKSIMPCLR